MGCCCRGSSSFLEARTGLEFCFFWLLLTWLSLPCDSLMHWRHCCFPRAAVAVCLSPCTTLVLPWPFHRKLYQQNPPKPGLLSWAGSPHSQVDSRDSAGGDWRQRTGDRDLPFCWQYVLFVSSDHILTGTEDSKKKVTMGLYPLLASCCRQINLKIEVQNDEIHLSHFITKSVRLLCHRLLFPCIYKDRLEEIPHFC